LEGIELVGECPPIRFAENDRHPAKMGFSVKHELTVPLRLDSPESISKPGLILLDLEMLSVSLHNIRDGVLISGA
jgi:hypothetical protein